jgi:hypothetical protein
VFKDARSIAVDGAGRVMWANTPAGSSGFDSAARSLRSGASAKTLLRIAADRKGTVCAAGWGHPSPRRRNRKSSWASDIRDVGLRHVALPLMRRANRDDIVRLIPAATWSRIREAISSAVGDSELNTGCCRWLGQHHPWDFQQCYFKFTPEGKFVTRFSGPGDQPGFQLRPRVLPPSMARVVYVSI